MLNRNVISYRSFTIIMNSEQISSLLIKNSNTRKYFRGTYPADRIPEFISNDGGASHPSCVCINTDLSVGPGEHWVAAFIESPKQIEYYDSLCQWPPKSQYIYEFLLKFPRIFCLTLESGAWDDDDDACKNANQFPSGSKFSIVKQENVLAIPIRKPLQNPLSSFCGQHCCYFLHRRCALNCCRNSFLSIVDELQRNLNKNGNADRFIANYYSKYIFKRV